MAKEDREIQGRGDAKYGVYCQKLWSCNVCAGEF